MRVSGRASAGKLMAKVLRLVATQSSRRPIFDSLAGVFLNETTVNMR